MKKKCETDFKGRIGVAHLKVCDVDRDWKEARDDWKRLAEQMRRAVNQVRLAWMVEHAKAGSPIAVRAYMDTLKAWNNTDVKTRGPKPKCSVTCITPAMRKAIWKSLVIACPGVHVRVLTLAMNLVLVKMKSTKSVKSAYASWMRSLAGDGEFPMSSQPQPIPFDTQSAPNNSPLLPPTKDDGDWRLQLRFDRVTTEGKKTASSTVDVLTLRTRGKHCASERVKLWKLATKEWKFCGSTLAFQESTGEWFVNLCYREKAMPEKPQLDPAKTAILWARKNRPWVLVTKGRVFRLGNSTAACIQHVRRSLIYHRLGIRGAYRSSANSGHGWSRWGKRLQKLMQRWKDFVKTSNQQAIAELDRIVREHGIGKVVYMQPTGVFGEGAFLATAGKVPGKRDASSWDWAQVGTLLHRKSEVSGVEVEVRKLELRGGNGSKA
jgi:hypothetical protein